MRKAKKENIVEIKEEVKIGNIILEVGDRIKVLDEKIITLDVDWMPDSRKESGLIQNAKDSLDVIIKPTSSSTADMTGDPKDLIKLLKHDAYFGLDDEDIEDLYPEVSKFL